MTDHDAAAESSGPLGRSPCVLPAPPFDLSWPSLPLDVPGDVELRDFKDGPPRTRIADPAQPPWCWVALLRVYQSGVRTGSATAFRIAPDVVLTAAHNLPASVDRATYFRFQFGCDLARNGKPGVECWGMSFARSRLLDVAVLTIDPPVAGSFSLAPFDGGTVGIAGYGITANGYLCSTYAAANGQDLAGDRLAYLITTSEGDSGAPVFADARRHEVVALHTTGTRGRTTGNTGVLLEPLRTQIDKLIATARRTRT